MKSSGSYIPPKNAIPIPPVKKKAVVSKMTNRRPRVIGFTAKNGAGKDLAMGILYKKYNYIPLSLSDIIRSNLVKFGLAPTRLNLINEGNQLRKDYGSDILGKMLAPFIEDGTKSYVIGSIRNPEEIVYFKEVFDMVLIALDAESSIRFERIRSRARSGEDKLTLEKFLELEKLEASSRFDYQQQLNAVFSLADIIVQNNGTPKELREELDRTLNSFK